MENPSADNTHLSPATVVASAARPARTQGSPVNPPITISSTYYNMGAPDGSMLYARWTNESWHPAEELIGRIEHAAHPALLHGSGMAAIANALHLAPAGSTIIMPRHAYHASLLVSRDRTSREGGTMCEVDIADTAAVTAAIEKTSAGMVWIESPTNPMLEIADIPAIAAAAHAVGALVGVDNTFATPLGQNPLELGADVVVHSATKYLSGHSDVVLGATVTNSPDLQARLQNERTESGAIAGPFEAWLLLRGMRTLSLRMERIWENAAELARRLAGHPLVAEVCHPSLESHPQHERARELMSCFGGVLTMRPVGGINAAEELGRYTELWLPATSLGGVESSFERRRRFPTEAPTVPEDLIRVSVGIEDIEDLWRDLDQALHAVHEPEA
ncbi:PLP-dependent transferase [Actinomycetaceae bacterium L2_0104]